ncbi:MAG: hypothetical protein MHM6MM_000908 [Cercozoa sp. M6MM]
MSEELVQVCQKVSNLLDRAGDSLAHVLNFPPHLAVDPERATVVASSRAKGEEILLSHIFLRVPMVLDVAAIAAGVGFGWFYRRSHQSFIRTLTAVSWLGSPLAMGALYNFKIAKLSDEGVSDRVTRILHNEHARRTEREYLAAAVCGGLLGLIAPPTAFGGLFIGPLCGSALFGGLYSTASLLSQTTSVQWIMESTHMADVPEETELVDQSSTQVDADDQEASQPE